jgi:hypothetical protein
VNANGSGLHTKALNQHIDEVEKLLAQLKSALPGSTREVNDEDSRPDKPVTPTSPINVPASGRCFLPSLDVSQALVSDYVHDFNKRIPLPAPEAIVFRIRDYYPGVAKGMASSWILTYFVFGIAHQLRALCPSATSYDRSQAEMYLGKCLNVSSTSSSRRTERQDLPVFARYCHHDARLRQISPRCVVGFKSDADGAGTWVQREPRYRMKGLGTI